MATRHQVVVPQQQRGGGVVAPKGKPRTAADGGGPDGKNRRALGDIGNLVTARGAAAVAAEGKPFPQVSRPITRSFGAQLLANAQAAAAAAAANKVQKPPAVVAVAAADGAARKGPAAKEAKPKAVTIKAKPEVVVVESSPESSVVAEETKLPQSGKKEKKKASSRKKVSTLTSVLTARSKAACGVDDETKLSEDIPDIDAPDTADQLAVVDYVEDLYKFYKLSENSSRPRDYIGSQAEINAKMRAILADWLIEVHSKFELMPECLYLTFHIIDRYLSAEAVPRRELQLVGVSAMLIACKYEEIWAPEVNDFIAISDRAYTRDQILAMEKGILNKLEWTLTLPTPYVFLVRFIKAASGGSSEEQMMEHMVFFLAELGLMQYSVAVGHSASMVAAAAVYAARCTLKKEAPVWTGALRRHTGFAESEVVECARLLVRAHAAAPTDKLRFVYNKYSSSQFGGVALHAPATELMLKEAAAAAAGGGISA